MIDGFAMINDVLNKSVKGISDIITRAGHINVDFADVREVMRDKGLAVMGTGKASGEGRARRAVIDAISSPLLENMSIAGARGVLLNISGSSSLGLHEISDAASVVYEQAHEDANIILGSVIDESLGEDVSVTVIATGFDEHPQDVQIKGTMLARDEKEKSIQKKQESFVKEQVSNSFDRKPYGQEVRTEIKYAAPAQEVPVYKEIPVEAAPVQEAPIYKEEPVQAAPVYQEERSQVYKVIAAPEVIERKEEQPLEKAREEIHAAHHDQEEHSYESYSDDEAIYAEQQDDQDDELSAAPLAQGNELERGGAELGSNVIQLKDLDVPTFMRKPNQDQQQQQQQYSNGKKKKKHKKNRNREWQDHNNR